MKLIEYINSSWIPEPIVILKYKEFIENLHSVDINYKCLEITEDFLESTELTEYFSKFKKKIFCICSGDIDFPPPKKPYKYDKYFNESILPMNYKEISYYEKVDLDIITVLEKNNIYVVSQDVSVFHQNILNMPLGIFPKLELQYKEFLKFRNLPKDILCYVNFGIPWVEQWFGRPRLEVFTILKDNPCVYIENTCNNERRVTQGLANFYTKIASSKFAVCPRGLGIDTYRLWDCIYLGCIPIVERYEGHKDWEDLPILFIDSFDFYKTMTSDILNTIYKSMCEKEYNYKKLDFSYWKERILALNLNLN